MDLRVVASRQASLLGSSSQLCTYRYGSIVMMHDSDQAPTELPLAPVFTRFPTPPGDSSISTDLLTLTIIWQMLEISRLNPRITRQLREGQ